MPTVIVSLKLLEIKYKRNITKPEMIFLNKITKISSVSVYWTDGVSMC